MVIILIKLQEEEEEEVNAPEGPALDQLFGSESQSQQLPDLHSKNPIIPSIPPISPILHEHSLPDPSPYLQPHILERGPALVNVTEDQPALQPDEHSIIGVTAQNNASSPQPQSDAAFAQSLQEQEDDSTNLRRRMRKRTIAQLYPYSIELASYKIQVRSHGIRPTKLIDSSDNVEEDPTVRFETESHAGSLRHHKRPSPEGSIHNNQHNSKAARTGSVGTTAVNLHKRVIRDSENEDSDIEQHIRRGAASQHQQQIYFSDSEDETNNNSVSGAGSEQLSHDQDGQNNGDWDPFGGDSDTSIASSIAKRSKKKGVLPASYMPDDDAFDLAPTPLSTPITPTSSAVASTPHRRGVAIHKKGERHDIQREIPDDVNVVKVQYHYQKQPKQRDIREFHEDDGYGGAAEYDVIDHMLSRGGGSRKSRPKKHSSRDRKRSVNPIAVSRNPRRNVYNGGNSRRSKASAQSLGSSLPRIPKKTRKPGQVLPAQTYHGSIVQNFIGNFQHRSSNSFSKDPAKDGVDNSSIPSTEPQALQKTKKRGPRPLAVVSGLHTPRNKPKAYSLVLEAESGRYAQRAQKRYRVQEIPEYPYEFPSAVFKEKSQPKITQYLDNNGERTQNPHGKNQHTLKKTSESISKVLDYLETGIPNEENLAEMDKPIDGLPIVEKNQQPRPIELLSPGRSNVNEQPKPKPLLTLSGSLERESYTQNFNVFPLHPNVWFEEDSFVGQGIFAAILKGELINDDETMDLDVMQWSGYFGPEIGKIDWTSHERATIPLTVVEKVTSVFELISNTWFNEETEVTSEQTDAAYYFLKFVCDYFFQSTNTVTAIMQDLHDYEDKLFEVANKTLGNLLTSIRAQGSTVSDHKKELGLVTVAFLSCFLYIPCFRRRRNLEPENLQLAFAFLAKKLLANFNDISNQLKDVQARINQNRFIVPRKPLFLIEICYVCIHLIDHSANAFDDSDAGTSFFLEIQKCVNSTETPAMTNLERNEIIWNAIFQFNTFYRLTDPTEEPPGRLLPPGGWKVVNSLVIPLFESLRRTTGTGVAYYTPETEITLSQIEYLKAVLARCINLLLTWKWLPDREILKVVYACFASIRYANLEPNDVGHHIAKFLKFDRNLKFEQWSRPAVYNDTVFELFLKYLAVTIKAFKKESKPRQQQRLIDLVNVLNAFKYPPRDSEIQVVELESLANQYNLLLTRYKFSSKTTQPPIEQLVGLFPLDNSHLLARKLSVDAWSVVCEIQLARNQSLKQTMGWYDQLVAKALDEYIQVDKLTPKQRLDKREVQRSDRRMAAYERYLFCPLRAVRHLLTGENRKDLLVKSTQWGLLMRKIFLTMLLAPEVKESLKFEILRILVAYLDSALYMKSVVRDVPDDMADNEDSQALMFVVPDDRTNYIDLLGRRYSSVIQFSSFKEFLNSLLADEPDTNLSILPTHAFIIKAIDIWVLTAKFLVPAGFGDWRMYYYSWQWFQRSTCRAKYEPYWLAGIVRALSRDYYEEERVKILQDLVRYLVCVHPTFEYEYVNTVFAREKELNDSAYFSPKTIMMINPTTFGLRDFGRDRSMLVQNIVHELGKLMGSPADSSRDGAKAILLALTSALKTNCKAINFKNENGYMEFVRQVVDGIIQHCKDIDVTWFMESSPFTAAVGISGSAGGGDSLRETRYKITKFKRMLQIDFSNEYMAGYKILYYFCLELQASVFSQNTCFTEIVSTALRPDRGSTEADACAGDHYRIARRFLVSAFIVPYLLEATTNRAVRIFLDPLLDTLIKVFETQRVTATRVVDEELYGEVLQVLENYIWINLNTANGSISSNSSGCTGDYWFWKCAATYFRLLTFGARAATACQGIELALHVAVFALSEAPRRLADLAPQLLAPLLPGLAERAATAERRRTATRARKPFYQPIAATFFGHVSYNYQTNQFYAVSATNAGSSSNNNNSSGGGGGHGSNGGANTNLTLIKFAGSWRARRADTAEGVYGVLLRGSGDTSMTEQLEAVLTQSPQLADAVAAVAEDPRSAYTQLRAVLAQPSGGDGNDTLLERLFGQREYHATTLWDDFII